MARIPDERYAPEKAEHSHVNTLREKLADMIRPTPPAATVEELPPRVVEAAAKPPRKPNWHRLITNELIAKMRSDDL